MPGGVVTGKYRGRDINVRVLPHGLDYEGELHRSLSAVAKAIAGTRWNGYHFFKLGKKGPNGDGQQEE